MSKVHFLLMYLTSWRRDIPHVHEAIKDEVLYRLRKAGL